LALSSWAEWSGGCARESPRPCQSKPLV